MAKNMLLWISVRAYLLKGAVNRKLIKWIMALAATNPLLALADGDLASMGDAVGEGADSSTKNVLKVAQLIGVIFFIIGLVAAKTKGKNPSITMGHIIGSLAIGAVLIVVPEMIKRSQSQMGLAPVTVG